MVNNTPRFCEHLVWSRVHIYIIYMNKPICMHDLVATILYPYTSFLRTLAPRARQSAWQRGGQGGGQIGGQSAGRVHGREGAIGCEQGTWRRAPAARAPRPCWCRRRLCCRSSVGTPPSTTAVDAAQHPRLHQNTIVTKRLRQNTIVTKRL